MQMRLLSEWPGKHSEGSGVSKLAILCHKVTENCNTLDVVSTFIIDEQTFLQTSSRTYGEILLSELGHAPVICVCAVYGYGADKPSGDGANCPINSYSASRDNWCTVGGDGGCRVGEVRAGTISPIPDHKGFKLQ